jgi:CRISPR/Cas system CSM-associated protein Csm3 (group 7 of RAMP superfamily)
MTNIKYKLTFFSDWHCGSGLSGGASIDNLVIKNKDGLPFLPGKTIKGLLREAAYDLSQPDDLMKSCFREADSEQDSLTFFSNAELTSKMQKEFQAKSGYKDLLFRQISSTQINQETGCAKAHTLRSLEVVIPITLVGSITNLPDAASADVLTDCLQMIKRLGENRNRGLGRCRFYIIKESEGGVK